MITFEALQTFARANDRRIFPTAGGRAKFMLIVHGDGLEYVPLSTNRGRAQKYAAIRRIVNYYNQTNSLTPGDYQSFTVNASYTLALIKHALNAEKIVYV